MKTCTKCKIEKEDSEFGFNKSRSDGLYSWCRLCASEKNREWRKNNKDKKAEMDRIYYKLNKEKIKERMRLWSRDYNNKLEIKEYRIEYRQNPERQAKRQLYLREYNKRPGKAELAKIRNRIRRDSQRNVEPEIVEYIAFLRTQPCCYCRRLMTNAKERTLDHVLPLSRGGTWEKGNLVTCCIKCNDSKATKTPDEWKDRWYMNFESRETPEKIIEVALASLRNTVRNLHHLIDKYANDNIALENMIRDLDSNIHQLENLIRKIKGK